MKDKKLKELAKQFAELEKSTDLSPDEIMDRMIAITAKHNLTLLDMMKLDVYIQEIFEKNNLT